MPVNIMEVILDTNFIISCIRNRIDFLNELKNLGFKIIVPREIFDELKDLRKNSSHEDKVAVEVALSLFEKNKNIKKTRLGAKNVDEGLIEMGKKGAYIATLDSYIKRSVKNKVVISSSKNGILVERS